MRGFQYLDVFLHIHKWLVNSHFLFKFFEFLLGWYYMPWIDLLNNLGYSITYFKKLFQEIASTSFVKGSITF